MIAIENLVSTGRAGAGWVVGGSAVTGAVVVVATGAVVVVATGAVVVVATGGVVVVATGAVAVDGSGVDSTVLGAAVLADEDVLAEVETSVTGAVDVVGAGGWEGWVVCDVVLGGEVVEVGPAGEAIVVGPAAAQAGAT